MASAIRQAAERALDALRAVLNSDDAGSVSICRTCDAAEELQAVLDALHEEDWSREGKSDRGKVYRLLNFMADEAETRADRSPWESARAALADLEDAP